MSFDYKDLKTQASWAPQSWFSGLATEEGVASYFGHNQNGYQRFRHARLIDELSKAMSSAMPESLLDLGCATGFLTDRLRRTFSISRAVGMDFVPEVLQRGRDMYPDVEFLEAALPSIEFVGERFDLVVASEVLYYLTPEAREKAVDSICNVMSEDAVLLVGAALGEDYFSSTGIVDLLRESFDVVSVGTQHMRYYHLLVSPFNYAARIDYLLSSDTDPGSESMRVRFKRLRPVLSFLPVRVLIKMVAFIGRPVLSSSILPAVVSALSRWSKPTNITVIGRKKSKT